MFNEDFYSLVPGAIGQVQFRTKTAPPSEEIKAEIQDQIASQAFSQYLATYQFTKGDPKVMDPQTAFIRARQQGARQAEGLSGNPVVSSVNVQIGQEESVRKLEQIEKLPGFMGWVDETMVNMIKTSV